MSDVVERLAEHADQAHECGSLGWRDMMNDAKDEIIRLRAALATSNSNCDRMASLAIENAGDMLKLRAALKPFAEAFNEEHWKHIGSAIPTDIFVRFGDGRDMTVPLDAFRTAKSLITENVEGSGNEGR